MDVANWLQSLGLERYEAAFRENEISPEVLSDLTAEDLEEVGVAAIGHRRRLLVAIAKLREDIAAPRAVKSIGHDRAPASPAERRQITVLLCDIVGSTRLSTELDPEELREILSAYQRNVATAVTGERGYIARFVGDGVLAFFGWPNPDEAHPESAVRAGLAIIDTIGSQRLSVRIGIATGLVVTGNLVGVGAAQTITAVGKTPNLAARLQTVAQPDTVVVSDATRMQLGQMFELEDMGLISLKGFESPVRPWRVLRKTAAASRSEVVHGSALTPLVGRDEELDLLLRRWREAKTGEGRVVLLSGEAGIGKSRLLAALEERLTGEPHVNLRYFCSPHRQDSPLYPIVAWLEREAGFARGDTAADRLAKLEQILAPASPPVEDVALLAALLAIPADGRYPILDLSPQQRKMRTFTALLRRLAGLARREPMLFLFEDAHWSDPTSVELLAAVIERVPDLPVLLIVSFRPEFAAPWFGRPRVNLMALSRLDRQDATLLASQVVKAHAMSAQLLDRIAAQSDGVPLFIEELSKAVLETSGAYPAEATLAVPDTLQATLMARLDRLPAAKRVAQIGAVIGREFPYTLIEAIAELPDAQLTEGLDELAAAGLLFRRGALPDAVYTFKHALVRDVVYASLLKAPRQQLHRKAGDALRDEFPERAEAEPEVVAYHFAQAGAGEAAIEWWSKAGDLALQRLALTEAISHLEKALELSRRLGDSSEHRITRLSLQISHGHALRLARGLGAPETLAAFEEVYDSAAIASDAPQRFAALHGLWSVRFQRGDLPGMRTLAHEFLRDVAGRPDLPETGVAHRLCGMTNWCAGEFIDARQHLETALSCYDSERDRPLAVRYGVDPGVLARAYLASTLWRIGMVKRARCLIETNIARALGTKHIPTVASAYGHALVFEMWRRDRTSSARYARLIHDVAHEHGMSLWLAYNSYNEGWLRCLAGDHTAGLTRMRDSLRPFREQGYAPVRPMFGVLLAEAEAAAGHRDAAIATIDDELERMTQTGMRVHLAEAARVRGEILLTFSPADTEAAEAAFLRAIDVARAQSAKRLELLAAMRLARLWTGQGKRAEHAGLLSILAEGVADGFDFDGVSETPPPE